MFFLVCLIHQANCTYANKQKVKALQKEDCDAGRDRKTIETKLPLFCLRSAASLPVR